MSDILKPDLDELVAKWAPVLRLQDWTIRIGYHRRWSFYHDELCGGDVSCLVKKRDASIRILDPIDYCPDWLPPMDIEYTVVHELVHLHIEPFYAGGNVDQMEQAVHALATALIGLDRRLRCATLLATKVEADQ